MLRLDINFIKRLKSMIKMLISKREFILLLFEAIIATLVIVKLSFIAIDQTETDQLFLNVLTKNTVALHILYILLVI
jgi:hypothetical protein